MDLKGKKVAVIGLSLRTGVAVVEALSKRGAEIIVSDTKERAQLEKQLDRLRDYNFECDFGGHSDILLESDLMVVSPGVPLKLGIFKKAVARGIPVISEVELAYNLTKARIIGITGTNGKTTTTALTGDIFKRGVDSRVKVAGNIGIPLISVVDNLQPGDWIVAELSSFQLEAVKNFRPRIGVFLNFSPDHLDRHQSEHNYLRAKANIFTAQKKSDYAVVNMDQPQVVKSAKKTQGTIYGVSLKQTLEQGLFLEENKLVAQMPEYTGPIIARNEIPLKGQHNVYNTSFAIVTALLAGISRQDIVAAIKQFKLSPHRLETVFKTEKNITVIDDSKATNPAAAVEAIKAVEEPILLIAGGQKRGAEFSELASLIKERVKKLILLGETSQDIKEAVMDKGFSVHNIYEVEDMEGAVRIVAAEVEAGDCVLLSPACPSWDMYSSYKQRGEIFSKFAVKFLQNE